MPIKILPADQSVNEIAWLCDDVWDLPTQLHELEQWLDKNKNSLPKKKIIADIGFHIRENAFGGGAILTAEKMKEFSKYNIDIHFSEYPS